MYDKEEADQTFVALTKENVVKSYSCHDFFSRMTVQKTFWEYFLPLDLSHIFRRHLVWAKGDGQELLNLCCARYSSTTVFISLLLSAELGTFFSPSSIIENVRIELRANNTGTLRFWAGITLCVSILFSIGALIANFTALSVISMINKENAEAILRSNLGLYAAQLPARLAIASIYSFFAWIAMFWWIGVPDHFSIALIVAGFLLISHVTTTFSALSRVIMATSAMSKERILHKRVEERLTPAELNDVLLYQTHLAHAAKVDVMKQYRMQNYHEHVRSFAGPYHLRHRNKRSSRMIVHGSYNDRNCETFQPHPSISVVAEEPTACMEGGEMKDEKDTQNKPIQSNFCYR